MALPGYPFQRKRYWIEPGNTARFGLEAASTSQPVAPAASPGPASNSEQEMGKRDEVMTALLALLEEALGARLSRSTRTRSSSPWGSTRCWSRNSPAWCACGWILP